MRHSLYGVVGVLLGLSRHPLLVLGGSSAKDQVALSLSTATTTAISNDDALERDAFHIFNSVHHLLRQWGNTLSPNGFSFTRGTIPIGTNLYHARGVSALSSSTPGMSSQSLVIHSDIRHDHFLTTIRKRLKHRTQIFLLLQNGSLSIQKCRTRLWQADATPSCAPTALHGL